MEIRIKGLVATVNALRQRLSRALSDAERSHLAREVRSARQWVEATCREAGTTPAHLPGPSRAAYAALREMEKTALAPVATGGAVAASAGGPCAPAEALPGPAGPPRVKNLVAAANWLADHLWLKLPQIASNGRERQAVMARVRRTVAETRSLCTCQRSTPADLVEPSRSAFAWLAFLDAGGLDAHVEALLRARAALTPDLRVGGLPVLLHLRTTSVLWKVRRFSNCLLVTCSEGFLSADSEFWRRFFESMALNARDVAASMARDQAATDEFNEVMLEVESHVEPPDDGRSIRGVFHDLSASFDRVNATLLGGTMDRPALAWSRSATVRTLGLYIFSRDRIVVSQSLDDASVPQLVLDYVMYHELLHKKLGLSRYGGRSHAHTPEFRNLERAFPGFAEAQVHIESLVKRLRA